MIYVIVYNMATNSKILYPGFDKKERINENTYKFENEKIKVSIRLGLYDMLEITEYID